MASYRQHCTVILAAFEFLLVLISRGTLSLLLVSFHAYGKYLNSLPSYIINVPKSDQCLREN